MKLPIIQAPNPILRQYCGPVIRFDEELRRLAGNMLETLRATIDPKGIGLAANQVGRPMRLIVLAVPAWPDLAMCNPIIEKAKGTISGEELCLSEPGVRVRVKRAAKIRVKYWDVHGQVTTVTVRDLMARCIQHEIDHLDGIMLSDHIPNIAEGKTMILPSKVTAHA